MSQSKAVLGPIRLPFLVLPPACVLLGASVAIWTGSQVNPVHVILALAGALAAHIGVNALNEYFDFRSGLDFQTRRTPFSGGSGTLPADPAMARSALTTGLLALAVTVVIGIYFLAVWGWSVLPLGLIGVILIVAYTPWITRSPFLCLLAPGLGFGVLMVMGTAFVLAGEYSWTAFVASLVPTFLVSDLLLLNQFPDVDADRRVGRRHYPIVLGRRKSSLIYALFLFLAYLSVPAGVILDLLPTAGLLGLLTSPLAVHTALGVYRHADDLDALIPYLGHNVLITVATPVLVAIGLLIAA
jgi:1,4-dihydroxy-2-naphthoate octaprenyltransferase